MTISLEKVVRPFQNEDVFNARYLAPSGTPTTPAGTVTAEWGNPIELQYRALGTNYQFFKVVDKETEIRRVENPEDPEQYVDVERILRLTMQDHLGGEINFNLKDIL